MIYEACTGHDILDLELGEMDFPRDTIESMAHQLPQPELSCVMRDAAGTPLACFGLHPLWPGVAEAWAFLSRQAMENPVSLSRAVKRQLEITQALKGFRRVQTMVKDGHLDGHRWVRWLGFEPDGILHNYGYGGKGTMWIYSRCTGDR